MVSIQHTCAYQLFVIALLFLILQPPTPVSTESTWPPGSLAQTREDRRVQPMICPLPLSSLIARGCLMGLTGSPTTAVPSAQGHGGTLGTRLVDCLDGHDVYLTYGSCTGFDGTPGRRTFYHDRFIQQLYSRPWSPSAPTSSMACTQPFLNKSTLSRLVVDRGSSDVKTFR